jgi:hypothetical protein
MGESQFIISVHLNELASDLYMTFPVILCLLRISTLDILKGSLKIIQTGFAILDKYNFAYSWTAVS